MASDTQLPLVSHQLYQALASKSAQAKPTISLPCVGIGTFHRPQSLREPASRQKRIGLRARRHCACERKQRARLWRSNAYQRRPLRPSLQPVDRNPCFQLPLKGIASRRSYSETARRQLSHAAARLRYVELAYLQLLTIHSCLPTQSIPLLRKHSIFAIKRRRRQRFDMSAGWSEKRQTGCAAATASA